MVVCRKAIAIQQVFLRFPYTKLNIFSLFSEMVELQAENVCKSHSCKDDLFTNFVFGMVVPEGWWMFCWRNLETKLVEGIWRYQASLSTIYLLGPSLGTVFDKRKIDINWLEFPKWSPIYFHFLVIGTWTFWAQKNHVEVCDLGAFGGHYSSWLNDTGLVTAYAFDGTPRVEELTQGRVRYAPLQEAKELPVPCDVPRSDWSVCVCVWVFWVGLMSNHVYLLVDGLKFETYVQWHFSRNLGKVQKSDF